MSRFISFVVLLMGSHMLLAGTPSGSWRDASHRAVLTNSALEATFQAGQIIRLEDRATGETLQSVAPENLPSQMLIFDTQPTDLDACSVTTEVSGEDVTTTCALPNGDELRLRWSIEEGEEDLVLQASSRTAAQVGEIRYNLFGCGKADHALVWINVYGAGQVMGAGWTGVQIGDPQRDGIPGAIRILWSRSSRGRQQAGSSRDAIPGSARPT